jgi:hypothetical protein
MLRNGSPGRTDGSRTGAAPRRCRHRWRVPPPIINSGRPPGPHACAGGRALSAPMPPNPSVLSLDPTAAAARRRPGRLLAGLLTALSVATPSPATTSDGGGFVVELQGDWRVESPTAGPLRRWDEVAAGATLRIVDPGRGDRVQIVGKQGLPLLTRSCANLSDCAGTIALGPPPASAGAASGVQAMLASVIGKLRATPDRPSSHISRGTGDGPELLDQVLAAGDSVDLAPVFAKAPRGRYRLRIQPVVRDSDRSEGLGPMQIDWEPGAPLVVSAGSPPLAAGLHEVALLREGGRGRGRASGSNAWILLAAPAQRADLADRFAQARRLTDDWAGSIEPEAARVLLRTWLEDLSSTAGR